MGLKPASRSLIFEAAKLWLWRTLSLWVYMANLGDVCTFGFSLSGGQVADRAGGRAAYEKPKVQKMTGIT